MIVTITTLLVASLVGAAPSHQEQNSVYAQLLKQGVSVASDSAYSIPEPTMPDGLDAAAQQKIIDQLAGDSYTPDQLLRDSVVSRHVLKLELEEKNAPARRLDTWFVAYSDLDAISNKDFLEQLLESGSGDEEVGDDGHELTLPELNARNITISEENAEHESFANGSYRLIKKVEVQGTLHSFWSRTPDSIVIAGILDSRFSGDKEYPNVWRAMNRAATGKLELGEATPYQGSGFYLKITRMVEPEGALFVEGHLILSEPEAWFNGENLLGSKLPAVVQNRVRETRRQFKRAERDFGAN